MVRNVVRGFLIGGVLGLVALVLGGEGEAFGGWWQRRYDAAAAMYGGTVCNPCGQQLVCNYVPQTSYRVQYCQVPTVTYRPVTSCDPCTGCQTTCMKPTTCYVQQARYVPYNTYRLVYSVAQPACPTATTAYYAAPPAVYAAPAGVAPTAVAAPAVMQAAPSGCSSCQSGRAATTYYAPSANYAAPSTSNYAYGTPAYAAPSTTSTPAYGSGPSYSSTPSYYNVPAATMPTMPPAAGSGIVNNGSTMVAPSLPTVAPYTTPSSPAAPQMPTPAPPQASISAGGSGTPSTAPPTVYEKKADANSTDAMKPIPDPQISTPTGPKLGPTSSPRLYDPQDKTAIAWPVEQAWSYTPVGASDWKPVTAATASVAERQPIMQAAVLETSSAPAAAATVESGATLGAPLAPRVQIYKQPTVDADGWQASGR